MIKGLILDLDGVITDTAEYHYLAWKSLADSIGIEIDRIFNEQLKGISRVESLERILTYGGQETAFSEEEKVKLAAKKNEEYKESIKQITPADLLPGIDSFLKEAEEAGIKLALASASKNAPFILEQLKIKEKFIGIVDPNTLSHGKPDPEIFIKGAELLGFSTEDCVGIEDAEAGVESINSAHMFSVGVGSPEVLSEADYVVESTEQLSLENILQRAQYSA